MPDLPPPPYIPEHLDIGVAVYQDYSDEGQHFYHHWAIVVEEASREPDSDIDTIDHQRMHILHFRDYQGKDECSRPADGQVQVFKGEARLGGRFDKIIGVGKIHITRVPELPGLVRELAAEKMAQGQRLSCQSFVELVLDNERFRALLVERYEYRLRLYGQMHDPAPRGVYEHAYSYADDELAKNPSL